MFAFGPMVEALSSTALWLLLAGGVLTASGLHFAAVLDAVVLGS